MTRNWGDKRNIFQSPFIGTKFFNCTGLINFRAKTELTICTFRYLISVQELLSEQGGFFCFITK